MITSRFEKAERAFAGLKNVNRDAMAQTTIADLVFAAETELDLYMEGESKMTVRQAAQIRAFVEAWSAEARAAEVGR